ncbi:hypothetical protein EXIGLDRAFT_730888 [Exidia glandulosa HHB12029]|uniref:Uncharacterized protein n=1 Tax=Exidia glandulosa HHB12029 TaxID=1314781 RepID=A0A165PWU5_EXIGL|nr:hypothetical protein EXIGLDRAFT_730888 [Exidia glandulosa HHB12029]
MGKDHAAAWLPRFSLSSLPPARCSLLPCAMLFSPLAIFAYALLTARMTSAAFHLRSPFVKDSDSDSSSQANSDEEEHGVCKRTPLEEVMSPLPVMRLYPRADGDPTVGLPGVNASIGGVNAGIGNVNITIGNVTVAAGDIELENITIGNVTVIVSVAFNGGNAGPATQTSISSSATSISSSTSTAGSTTSDSTTITQNAGASPTASPDGLDRRQEGTTSTVTTSDTSSPTSTIDLPAPTVTGDPIGVGVGPVDASVGNITVAVGNINVSLGNISIKNVTIGNIFVLVQLGDPLANNSLVNNLIDGL